LKNRILGWIEAGRARKAWNVVDIDEEVKLFLDKIR